MKSKYLPLVQQHPRNWRWKGGWITSQIQHPIYSPLFISSHSFHQHISTPHTPSTPSLHIFLLHILPVYLPLPLSTPFHYPYSINTSSHYFSLTHCHSCSLSQPSLPNTHTPSIHHYPSSTLLPSLPPSTIISPQHSHPPRSLPHPLLIPPFPFSNTQPLRTRPPSHSSITHPRTNRQTDGQREWARHAQTHPSSHAIQCYPSRSALLYLLSYHLCLYSRCLHELKRPLWEGLHVRRH